MLPGSIAGLAVNVIANMLLIPIMGSWGAAWSGVLTYLVYSFCILFACRTVMKIEYPWLRSLATTAAFCGTYVGLRYGCFPHMNEWQQIGISVGVCAFWAVFLFGNVGLDLAMERLAKSKSSDADTDDSEETRADAAPPELVEA